MKFIQIIKNLALLFIMSVVLLSCAISDKIHLSDGSEAYEIHCDGAAIGINVCFEKAMKLCGANGFKMLNNEGRFISSVEGMANNSSINYGPLSISKSITIKCEDKTKI